MTTDTVSPEFFENKYSSNPDPWNFATSGYEQFRYQAQLKALNRARYRRAFEPGCSVGAFTALLAGRCDHVQAIDIAPSAVQQARARCSAFPNVSIAIGRLPEEMPPEEFDLIVFSEIGYYFDPIQLSALARRLAAALVPNGTLLATHWLGHSADHLLHGDEVHAILRDKLDLTLTHSERHPSFRIDRWERI